MRAQFYKNNKAETTEFCSLKKSESICGGPFLWSKN